MVSIKEGILPVNLEQEVKKSYLDYAMSVIVGRALPDCRDGLKPVHRRILYAMHELGNTPNKPYKKSSRIVGDVLGKYHPHGETAVYDAIVRMAQDFSMRYQIIDGHGNFGSIDGDPAASTRYTEIRMRDYAVSLLEDIEKDTVNYSPNYDGSEKMPDVLPAKIPNFLVNGTSGIAVGMATQTPPHNISEVLKAFLHYVDNPDASVDDLMQFMPGPDFPTGATIIGTMGIKQAYLSGKGRVKVRGVTHIEENNGKRSIIITELPYQVNKARLVEKIAELARDKKLEGISALRDESDKDGMRVVIELKRDTNDQVLLNHLYQNTQLQNVFAINMVGLSQGQPQTLTLRSIFHYFYIHRQEVLVRKTKFLLSKAKNKYHILEGLAVALDNIDAIIEMIKTSSSTAEAKERLGQASWGTSSVNHLDAELRSIVLISQYQPYGIDHSGFYKLSTKQIESILEMRLQKLTSMEQEGIKADFSECLNEINYLRSILNSDELRIKIIKEESLALIEEFGDKRRTQIIQSDEEDILDEDLITPEQLVITMSSVGYIKTQPLSIFEAQRRGGKGKSATRLKSEDSIAQLLVAHSHDHLLCFSTSGKVYKLRVFELPSGSRNAAGKPIVNCLPLSEGETISALLTVKSFDDDQYIFMTTQQGTVKKVSLNQFTNTRSSGLICIDLDEGDLLQHAFITDSTREIMMFGSHGKAIRFAEEDVRPTGRASRGVRGMRIPDDSHIVSAFAIDINQTDLNILTASLNGFGKCTPVELFTPQSRGGMGVIAMSCSPRNGQMMGALLVHSNDHVMFLTSQGMILRTPIDSISISSRNTQGVRLVKLNDDDTLTQIQCIHPEEMGEDTIISNDPIDPE